MAKTKAKRIRIPHVPKKLGKNGKPLVRDVTARRTKLNKRQQQKRRAKKKLAKPTSDKVIRNKKGQIQKGSKGIEGVGHPKLGDSKLDHLLKAVRKVESEENENLLEHFIRQGFHDNHVLIAVLKKLHPDLKAIEATITAAESEEDAAKAAIMREHFRKLFSGTYISQEDFKQLPQNIQSSLEEKATRRKVKEIEGQVPDVKKLTEE